MPTLKELLKDKLSEKELSLVSNSYDTVGSIAIFAELKKELKKKEKIIAETLIQNNSHILTIAKKTGKYSGKYRLPKINIIAGIKTKEAVHKENNCVFKLNIEKCYFSSRSASERLRLSKLVKNNESVLVMFSGIGVFPIVIAKNSKPKEMYGIEINPACHKYAEENKKLNKVNITFLKGDVKKIIPKLQKEKNKFDRIIMPLPKSAEDFLETALKVSKKGTIIHFYDFSQEKDFPEQSINKIKSKIKNFKVLNSVLCGRYSPYTHRVCIDFQII